MRGYVHPDFESVRSALELCVPAGRPGGAAVCVIHRGEKVVDLATGTADASGRPFDTDSLAVSMSTTKGVTSTALHRLVSLGQVRYDDPVARYWPEFAANGKERITVRQALAHQAGLHDVYGIIPSFDALYDWTAMTDAIAAAAPRYAPGTNFGYHAFTFGWLIGEIIRRVAGTDRFEDAFDQVLAKPLGLSGGLEIGVSDASMPRVADFVGLRSLPRAIELVRSHAAPPLNVLFAGMGMNPRPVETFRALLPPGIVEADLNAPAFRRAPMPAVNGHFSASALAGVYGVLAEGGLHAGEPFLRGDVVAESTRDHNGYYAMCRVIPFPMRIKLGYHRAVSLGLRVPVGSRSVDLGVASPGAVGHFGFGGSGGWADPERRLAVGLVTNTFFGRLPMDLRTVAIATTAANSADRRRN